jgi:uncharacterized protein YbcI
MPDTRSNDGSVSAEISRRAVRILREYTGRGPTKALTVLTKDTVAIILADTLTKGELSLVGMGEEEQVLRTRRSYQQLMRPDLVGLVEEQTGRTVHAFFSDNQIDPDYGVEFFLLEPFPSKAPESSSEAKVDTPAGKPARAAAITQREHELREFRDAGVLTEPQLEEQMARFRWGLQ